MLQTMMHQLLCSFGAGRSICLDKLYSLHRTETAHVADKRMLLLPRTCLMLKLFAQCAGTRQQLAIGKFFEHRQCGGATCRVATESPAEAARAWSVHDLSTARDGCKRQASAERLGRDNKVGLDAEMSACEELPCAPEAGLNFIGNKDDA